MRTRDRLLIVEGKDDLHTIVHLIGEFGGLPEEQLPLVISAGGVENLLRRMPTYIKSVPLLGLVVDADEDPRARWLQLRQRLVSQGLSCPEQADPAGTVTHGIQAGWQVGVWMMPDNQGAGAIEGFLETLVPQHQNAIYSHACTSTDRARELGAPFRHIGKARIHTWLAWQEFPGLPYGSALKARTFDASGELAQRFVTWTQALYKSNITT